MSPTVWGSQDDQDEADQEELDQLDEEERDRVERYRTMGGWFGPDCSDSSWGASRSYDADPRTHAPRSKRGSYRKITARKRVKKYAKRKYRARRAAYKRRRKRRPSKRGWSWWLSNPRSR